MNSPITIQRGIPIPERYTSHLELRAKLKAMKVGDSFIYPTQTVLYWAAEKEGVRITTRKMDGEGFRVWRIEARKP